MFGAGKKERKEGGRQEEQEESADEKVAWKWRTNVNGFDNWIMSERQRRIVAGQASPTPDL